MRKIITPVQVFWLVLGLVCLGSLPAYCETVYSEGHNITSEYQLSDTLIQLTDTLTISRTVTNNESFALTGLYFSDNLPPAATIIDYDLQIGGVSMTPAFTDRQADAVVSGSDAYWWQIDEPQNPGGVHDTVGAGETASLTIRLVFDLVGSYSLPLHTTVFMGDTIPFFATEDSLFLRTYIPAVFRTDIDRKIKDFLEGKATEEEVRQLIKQYHEGGG